MAVRALSPAALPALSAVLWDRRHALVASGVSKDPNGKVTVMAIGPDRRPAVVAKIAGTARAEDALAAEAAMLIALDRSRLGAVEPTVPAVLGWAQQEGRPALMLSGLPGRNMLARYHSWRHTSRPERVRADFEAVDRWLSVFQSATASGTAELADGTIAARIQARFHDQPIARPAGVLLGAVQEELVRYSAPGCAVHGDLWPGNLLEAGGAVTGVVDWEAGRVAGPALCDPIRYALTYALYLDRHTAAGAAVAGHKGLRADRWGAGIRHLFDGDSWFGDIAGGFVGSALGRMGADPGLWRHALAEGLAGIAASADDPAFAMRHLELFVELAPGLSGPGAGRGAWRTA